MTVFCSCMIGPNDPDPKCGMCHGTGQADEDWLREFADHFENASGEPNRDYEEDAKRFRLIAERIETGA
jgi:hypothetical protein